MKTRRGRWMWLAAVAGMMLGVHAGWAQDTGLRAVVEADWTAQEKRLGRKPDDAAAIADAIRRAKALLDDLRGMGAAVSQETAAIARLETEANKLDRLDEAGRLTLYRNVRWAARTAAFRNPLIAGKPIVFMQRRRFICQMLHEYLGYYYDGISGGGVYVLDRPGMSLQARDLIRGRLPEGNYTTLSLSYDAKTVYFAFAPKDLPKPDFYKPENGRRYFHVFAMNADGTNLRQLTDGPVDDFDPCELPDGAVAFMSWRRGAGFVRCNNPWEPLPAYTLHRLDADGKNIRTLSFHETNEWHPSVLNDGRIVYIRWDYVDRSAANYHGLWVSNPDGTNPSALWGNYTERINACYQPRAIPGSNKIMFVAGAHHAVVGGSLVMVDPQRARLNPKSGEDEFGGIEVLTPEVCFPESAGWPKGFFHGPWPLSDKYYLVAFGYDVLPGMSSGNGKDSPTGLYYLDRFGNRELLYQAAGISSMYPIPLAAREKPPALPSLVNPSLGDEGEFVLTDVRRSLMGMPSTRPISELRIFQVLPKTTHIANQPKIGHANAESARMLLGTVPVEPDGSAYFRAPAKKPLYFQAVDETGKAVHTMRSVTYLQPGERRGCVGCHEPASTAGVARATAALRRQPSTIQPAPDGTRPFSYTRLVQPLLDQRCVRCHDGTIGQGKSRLLLTGDPAAKGPFTRSYDSLRPYVKWYEWGGESIDRIATRPGHGPASDSPLTAILDDPTHANEARLTDSERRRLYIWLDGNVPFYGTYSKEEQAAQKRGQTVREPQVQ